MLDKNFIIRKVKLIQEDLSHLEEFAREIAPSAGLRNRLVHEYNDSDQKIIYQSMGDALKQYTRYCR